MKGVTGKFSLRDFLQIIIPGIYFMGLLKPIFDDLNFANISNSSNEVDVIILSILSLLSGMIIYSIDIPKKVWFFKKNLPTTLIKKNLSNIENVHNKYFQFYDDKISDKQKAITEKYTSIYHFAINIVITSLVLTLVYFIIYKSTFLTSYGIITLLVLILSAILAVLIFYGDRKIKYMFKRQYDKFTKSLQN